jgi:hypothetical protein
MNDIFAKMVKNHTPQFNKDVTEGISPQILRTIPEFLDSIIRTSIRSLTPNVNLKYKGYRRLTPKEEFNKLFSNAENKTTYDLAASDLYMIELQFEYNGEPFTKHLYLPFTERGNLIRISNTTYHIVPVLSDTVISPSHKEVFVRLLKDKLTFRGTTRNFIVNGEKIPGEVIHSNIVKVNETQISDNIGKPLSATSLYPLCEYGFVETCKRYFKTKDFIVTDGDASKYVNTHNIYESTKIKPRGLKEVVYTGHDIKICVPKKLPVTPMLENFIFGLIYVMDIFPDQTSDFLMLLELGNVEKEKLYWRILLGRISYKNSYSVDRIVVDINDHFTTLQGYMDELIKGKLRENGVVVDNFFDLLMVIMDNYNIWLLNSKEYNGNINNRYIDILYYIMYEIIVGFNKVILAINKRAQKRSCTSREILKIVNNELTSRKIFGLVKSKQINLSVMLADYTSDIMYPKITAVLEDQSRGNGVKRGTKSQFPDSTKTIKGQDLVMGSLLFLTKTAPSPRFRANVFLKYSPETGKLIIPDDLARSIAKLDTLLQGKMENSNIKLLDDSGNAFIPDDEDFSDSDGVDEVIEISDVE